MGESRWEALPMETWFLEGGDGGRDYISPSDMYESLMGRNAEIREGRGVGYFLHWGRDKASGSGEVRR